MGGSDALRIDRRRGQARGDGQCKNASPNVPPARCSISRAGKLEHCLQRCSITTADDASSPGHALPTMFSGLAADAFRLLVQSVEDYAIFMLDPGGRVLTWNRGAQRIKGYAATEIVGQHFSVFYGAEDLAARKPERELEVATREGRVEDEGWRLRKDGTRFWANVVITALRDDSGALLGFGKVTRDLTERRIAAEDLRRSEERFRLLVEGVGDYAIYLLDPQGKVSTWNSGAQKIKGYAPSEIIGQYYATFFTAEDVAAGRPELELDAARSVGRFEEEGWRVRKNGERFWANVVLTALRDATGQLIGFSKITRDLSARREAELVARTLLQEQAARTAAENAEQQIKDERERYKSLSRRLEVIFEGIADGITVQNRSGALIFANIAAARLCGFSSVERFLRTPPHEVAAQFDMFDEHGRPFDEANLPSHRVFAGAESAQVVMRVLQRATGRQWWTMIRTSPVRGDQGEPELAVNIWHDVTADRRREERERYLADATRTLTSSLDYETMLRSLAGVLVPSLADWCSIQLLDGEELKNVAVAHADPARVEHARAYGAKYPPDPQAERGVWHVMRTGRAEVYPEITDELLHLAARDEEHLQLLREVGMKSVITAPIKTRGKVFGTISLVSAESGRRYDEIDKALAEDLGDRAGSAIENARLFSSAEAAALTATRAAVAAEQASRVKDEFLATVSHELRTPLNAILGWASLLKNSNADPTISKGLDVIHRNAQAQGKIIEDILDVSRIITGKLRLDAGRIDLIRVAKDAIEVVRPTADAKLISIEFSSALDQALLVGDPERLQQVAWNLLSNALKFTDPGGSVNVTVTQHAAWLALTVSDNGRGIDPDFLPFVFDRFKQADSSTTRRIGGLGLGLAIVRHIVELHGGRVSVVSPGLGQGAAFTVELPLRAVGAGLLSAAEPSLAAESTDHHPALSLAGVRVLVVEDEQDARELLSTIMLRAGAVVAATASAHAAFELLEEFRPDVIVSDIAMPDEDGHSLMRRIRALGSARSGATPSIALTAYARAEDKTAALAAGFTTHIGKPIQPDDLIAAVSDLVGANRARRG